MSKQIYYILVALAVGLVVLGLFGVGGSASGQSSSLLKNKIECSVKLQNKALQDTQIIGVECAKVGSCYFEPLFFLPFYDYFVKNLQELTGIVDTGEVKLYSDGKELDSVEYRIGEFNSETYTLRGCTSETSGELVSYNHKGGVTSRKAFDVGD